MPPPIMTTSAEDLTSVSLTLPSRLDPNIKHVNFTGQSIADGITCQYPFPSGERSNIILGRSGAWASGSAIYSIKKREVNEDIESQS
jgi:hypothetical protein